MTRSKIAHSMKKTKIEKADPRSLENRSPSLFKKKIQPKLSKNLAKRVWLNAEQLERVKGQAGNGLATRYLSDGTQSLELTRKLAKAAKKAKRFVLYSDQLGKRIYISKVDETFPLTFEIKEALTFFHGFDNPELKIEYWGNRIPKKFLKFNTTYENTRAEKS